MHIMSTLPIVFTRFPIPITVSHPMYHIIPSAPSIAIHVMVMVCDGVCALFVCKCYYFSHIRQGYEINKFKITFSFVGNVMLLLWCCVSSHIFICVCVYTIAYNDNKMINHVIKCIKVRWNHIEKWIFISVFTSLFLYFVVLLSFFLNVSE